MLCKTHTTSCLRFFSTPTWTSEGFPPYFPSLAIDWLIYCHPLSNVHFNTPPSKGTTIGSSAQFIKKPTA